MAWGLSTWWWVACGLLVAAEMVTGTFYLLMLALGLAAAAVAAHAGLSFAAQLVVAAVVGGGAVTALEIKRRRTVSPPASANPDMNLDVGGQVQVEDWAADGTANVNYRGAVWAARWVGSTPPAAGSATIHAIEGSRLLLGP